MMSACQRIREAALDALAERQPMPENVRQHMQLCAACRADIEQTESLWNRLVVLPIPRPTPATTEQIAAALQSAAQNNRQEKTSVKVSWLAAALLAGVLLGGAAGMKLKPAADSAPPNESGSTFLLLLHESTQAQPAVSAAQMDSIVGEYRAWATRLREEQKLVGAEKLRDEAGRWLDPAGKLTVSAPDEHVSGYFVIRASDYDSAVAIARESPHLKYGGTIEVRAIQDTSGQ